MCVVLTIWWFLRLVYGEVLYWISLAAVPQLTRWCLQSWWQSGCHPGNDSRTGNLMGIKHTDWITHSWFYSVKGERFHFVTVCTGEETHSNHERLLCVLDVGKMNWLIHYQEKKKSCRVSLGSWLASIIHPLLAGRVYVPLPIARELELKCWHTSCIMWHWSDECSLPKSSTLSLVWAGIRLSQLLFLWRKTQHVTGISQIRK